MILVWNDAKSFQRHLEAMRIFRQSHITHQLKNLLLKDMPNTYDINLALGEKLITTLTDSHGKVILVPIWKIAAPAGSQN
jgi:hypothetical protein